MHIVLFCWSYKVLSVIFWTECRRWLPNQSTTPLLTAIYRWAHLVVFFCSNVHPWYQYGYGICDEITCLRHIYIAQPRTWAVEWLTCRAVHVWRTGGEILAEEGQKCGRYWWAKRSSSSFGRYTIIALTFKCATYAVNHTCNPSSWWTILLNPFLCERLNMYVCHMLRRSNTRDFANYISCLSHVVLSQSACDVTALNGKTEMVNFLISSGADVNALGRWVLSKLAYHWLIFSMC